MKCYSQLNVVALLLAGLMRTAKFLFIQDFKSKAADQFLLFCYNYVSMALTVVAIVMY